MKNYTVTIETNIGNKTLNNIMCDTLTEMYSRVCVHPGFIRIVDFTEVADDGVDSDEDDDLQYMKYLFNSN